MFMQHKAIDDLIALYTGAYASSVHPSNFNPYDTETDPQSSMSDSIILLNFGILGSSFTLKGSG